MSGVQGLVERKRETVGVGGGGWINNNKRKKKKRTRVIIQELGL